MGFAGDENPLGSNAGNAAISNMHVSEVFVTLSGHASNASIAGIRSTRRSRMRDFQRLTLILLLLLLLALLAIAWNAVNTVKRANAVEGEQCRPTFAKHVKG